MREFSKKELTLWRKFVFDDSRPILNGAIFTKNRLVITNGYLLVSYDISKDWQERYEGDDCGDYCVRDKELKLWIQNHTASAKLNTDQLFNMAVKQTGKAPDVQTLIDVALKNEPKGDAVILDPHLLDIVSGLFMDNDIKIETKGKAEAVVVRPASQGECHNDIALIMPKVY